MEKHEADVVIIESGVAGWMGALVAREFDISVAVLSLGRGASRWFQGVNVTHGHADPGVNSDILADDFHEQGVAN